MNVKMATAATAMTVLGYSGLTPCLQWVSVCVWPVTTNNNNEGS